MEEIYHITGSAPGSLWETMELLQQAATGHSHDLQIHFERMLEEFHCLWMIVRGKVHLDRLPQGEVEIRTWLRKPSSLVSIRDYSIWEGEEEIGYGIYSWALVSAESRKLVSMKSVPPVMAAPTVMPEREGAVKRITLPENMTEEALWTVRPEEIDKNGHVNNTVYLDRAEQLTGTFGAERSPKELTVCYLSEVRLGERITLSWTDFGGDGLTLDGTRPRADGGEKPERVFAAKLIF